MVDMLRGVGVTERLSEAEGETVRSADWVVETGATAVVENTVSVADSVTAVTSVEVSLSVGLCVCCKPSLPKSSVKLGDPAHVSDAQATTTARHNHTE